MVNTRSTKKNVSKSVNVSDTVHTYDCNVVIRIHEDALMEIDGKAHIIPIKNNDLNIKLHLVSEQNDSNLIESAVDSSKSSKIQVYKPATAMALKSVGSAWIQCKRSHKNNKQNVKVRDLVVAKLKGHSVWPSIILEMLPNKKAKVEFLGAEQHERFGFVNISEITLFKDSIDVILIQLKKKLPKFKKAVKEAEIYCGISEKYSAFNQ